MYAKQGTVNMTHSHREEPVCGTWGASWHLKCHVQYLTCSTLSSTEKLFPIYQKLSHCAAEAELLFSGSLYLWDALLFGVLLGWGLVKVKCVCWDNGKNIQAPERWNARRCRTPNRFLGALAERCLQEGKQNFVCLPHSDPFWRCLWLQENSDSEWKFSRSRLWMTYFERWRLLPVPLCIIPSPWSIYMFCMWIKARFIDKKSNAESSLSVSKIVVYILFHLNWQSNTFVCNSFGEKANVVFRIVGTAHPKKKLAKKKTKRPNMK